MKRNAKELQMHYPETIRKESDHYDSNKQIVELLRTN